MPPRSKRLSANAAPGESNLVIRNVTVLSKRTSLRMEPQMWEALMDVCRREQLSPHDVCSRIANAKEAEASLTGAIRVFLLAYFRHAATEEGHQQAGHGGGQLPQLQQAFGGKRTTTLRPRPRPSRTPRSEGQGNTTAPPA